MKNNKAFTLIELLIVVAIIAILAAIAVPNFLEAQVRSKVSRVKSDLRTLATGMESYYVDNNAYPMCNNFGVALNAAESTGVAGAQDGPVLEVLSTPIAYVTNSLIQDPFQAKLRTGGVYNGAGNQPGLNASYPDNPTDLPVYQSYQYQSMGFDNRADYGNTPIKPIAWVTFSSGPDLTYFNMGGILARNSISQDGRPDLQKLDYCINTIYDPTNGTISFGEIFRSGGQTNGDYAHFFFDAVERSGD